MKKKKKIEVFLRQCYYSSLQELPDRKRPQWFNKFKIFENFKSTLNKNLSNYTIVYDEFNGNINKTFLSKEKNVEIISCGNETESFLKTLNIVLSKNFDDDTIIYFLEDDYLHRPGWCDIMIEGFNINTSYLTLYDFDFFISAGYLTETFVTKNSHWRAVPATTNTFSCKYKTLKEDIKIHEKYSQENIWQTDICGKLEPRGKYCFTKDYDKFWELQKHNKYLISPMPGWSTHCDANHLSPIIDWEKIMNDTYHMKKIEKNEKIIYY